MTTIITPKLFAARRDLCVRAGLRTMTYEEARADSAVRSGRPDLARTIVHECGHGGSFLDRSTSYGEILFRADGTGHLSPGERPSGQIPRDRHRPLDAAVAAALGGVCAEQALLGKVSPWETVTDMQQAWTRADGDEHLVREQVRRLVRVFEDHRGAMRHLGNELRRAGRLTRADCVQFVRAGGWAVDVEPRYLPTRVGALSSNPRADADADAVATAKSEQAAAAIRADPVKYRQEWSAFARKTKPDITEEQIEASWQKLVAEYGLQAGAA